MTEKEHQNKHNRTVEQINNLQAALKALATMTGSNTDAANARITQLEVSLEDMHDAFAEHIGA